MASQPRRGVIYSLGPSPLDINTIWAGTDDGLIHITRDGGKSWANVTPKETPEWAMISLIEPSPFDAATAYAAVDAHKLDKYKPYIYKTADFGKTWSVLTTGLPDGSYVHAVREDPKRKGMLYAGTETGIWVSFDDGASWQPFQRNLPAVPVTDLTVKEGDLVVATQGRSFWILDDLTPLRLWNDRTAQEDTRLFPTRPSHRVQTEKPDEDDPPRGVGANMPNGVLVHYWLKEKPGKEEIVKIEGSYTGIMGLPLHETAALLEVSEATILRDWRAARAWLALTLRDAH